MMKKTLILLSGKAQAGKNTFALGLNGFNEYAFAAQLKKFAIQLGWNGEKDWKGRRFLQDLASVCRTYNENIWVNLLRKTLETDKYPVNIVITDCRYKNEIQLMTSWGKANGYEVIAVRIERPNHDNGLSDEMKMHLSETELDNHHFDHVIINSGTIDDLICIASSCFGSGSYSDLQLEDASTSL